MTSLMKYLERLDQVQAEELRGYCRLVCWFGRKHGAPGGRDENTAVPVTRRTVQGLLKPM